MKSTGKWVAHTKGGPNDPSFEIVVIREDYAHGILSYGWMNADDKRLISANGRRRRDMIDDQETWDELVALAALTAIRLNKEEAKEKGNARAWEERQAFARFDEAKETIKKLAADE